MDKQFLDAAALRLIAEHLIAKRPVEAEQLAELGQAYVDLEETVEAWRAGPGKSGRKPAAPTTEDGHLVERARAALSKVWGREASTADLARHLDVSRTQLSRCNGANPTPLSPLVRGHVRFIAEEGERREPVTAAPVDVGGARS